MRSLRAVAAQLTVRFAAIPHMKHTTDSHARVVNLRVAAAILMVVACALVISTYKYFGHTWDEPEHIAAGMQLIDRGIYTYDIQHPPLARVMMAIGPYLAGARSFGEPGPSGEQEGRDLLYRTGKYDLLLTLARVGMLPFFMIMMIATWLWARRYYGLAEATLATLFLVATPPILGHAMVAALDIPGAALCTLAFYFLLRWFERPGLKVGFALGIAAGLAIGTKLSALPFIGLVGVLWAGIWLFSGPKLELKARLKSKRLWLGAPLIAGLALFIATMCYGFSFKYLADSQHPKNGAIDYVVGASGITHDVAYTIAEYVPLPVGVERLITSIQQLNNHNKAGHQSYLLGKLSKKGFWYFYLVAIGVKTPIPLLIMSVAGFGYLAWRARTQGWMYAAPATAFVALLVFCSAYSHINIGLRHVFVLYPPMAIVAAVVTLAIWRRYKEWAPRAVIVALLGWQLSGLWTDYPDYLAYFNAFAGNKPEHVLIDSDLDWGQDLRRLETRLNELHVAKFGFVYRGTADVIGEHLPGVWMVQPFTPATGWVAASLYAKTIVWDGKAYDWLNRYKPLERIGKSIDLYYIPEAPGKNATPQAAVSNGK